MFYRKFKTTFFSALAMVIVSGAIGIATPAFAADAPTDLEVTVTTVSTDVVFLYKTCNNGPTPVKAFTTHINVNDFNIIRYSISEGSNASNLGTVDPVTGDWAGLMITGNCIEIGLYPDLQASPGDTINFTATNTSATLDDDTLNVDTNTANDTASMSVTAIEHADLALNARLKTTTEITSGSMINYELNISNVGLVDYVVSSNDDEPNIFFLMPEGAVFSKITDEDLNDNLVIDTSNFEDGCQNQGDVQGLLEGSAYHGDVIQCSFDIVNDIIPSNAEYKFSIEMQATSSFVSGVTEVRGVVMGADTGSLLFSVTMYSGGDFFILPINNIVSLTFDASPLIPTINPCAGQADVVLVDDACFTVSFNKTIVEGSFTQNQIVLGGTGTVSSFVQNSTNLWTVHVNGMLHGSVLTVSLVPGSISDLSARAIGTEVLGINIVRYGTPESQTANETPSVPVTATLQGTSANGTLAVTGTNSDPLPALFILLFGLMIAYCARRKQTI